MIDYYNLLSLNRIYLAYGGTKSLWYREATLICSSDGEDSWTQHSAFITTP
jgi:hypothetical protein